MPLLVLPPPHQYDHAYHGKMIERVLPLSEARCVCASMGAPADACAWVWKGVCHVIIPRNGPVHGLAPYFHHERAHCNGWDHSGSGYAQSTPPDPSLW